VHPLQALRAAYFFSQPLAVQPHELPFVRGIGIGLAPAAAAAAAEADGSSSDAATASRRFPFSGGGGAGGSFVQDPEPPNGIMRFD
jgi:hypothetical protein